MYYYFFKSMQIHELLHYEAVSILFLQTLNNGFYFLLFFNCEQYFLFHIYFIFAHKDLSIHAEESNNNNITTGKDITTNKEKDADFNTNNITSTKIMDKSDKESRCIFLRN